MKFLLDANFLMIPGQLKVDVFDQLAKFGKPELFTISAVVRELNTLSGGKGKDARAARLALGMVGKKEVKVLEAEGNADSILIGLASEGYSICTQDKGLQARLLEKGMGFVYLRQGKHLEKM